MRRSSGCCGTGGGWIPITTGILRSTLYNLAVDGWRRRGTRHAKLPLLARPRTDPGADGVATVDLRDALVRNLRELPSFQRAVFVLRYWEQLSHTEAAELLGSPEGT